MSTDFFTTDFSFLGSVEEHIQPSTKTTRRRQSKVREVAGVQYTVTRSPELVDKMVATRRQRSGYVVTEEHRAKISATLTGRPSKFKGVTGRFTDEQLAKMRANHRGGPRVGYVTSAETREKQRQAALRRAPRSRESIEAQAQKQFKPVMTPHGRFPSLASVAIAAGVSGTTVRKWIKKYPLHYYYIKDSK